MCGHTQYQIKMGKKYYACYKCDKAKVYVYLRMIVTKYYNARKKKGGYISWEDIEDLISDSYILVYTKYMRLYKEDKGFFNGFVWFCLFRDLNELLNKKYKWHKNVDILNEKHLAVHDPLKTRLLTLIDCKLLGHSEEDSIFFNQALESPTMVKLGKQLNQHRETVRQRSKRISRNIKLHIHPLTMELIQTVTYARKVTCGKE